jgi:hypothetical protein
MAGGSPEHHMDWMGYCLGDCSVAVILAFENFGVIGVRVLQPRPIMPYRFQIPDRKSAVFMLFIYVYFLQFGIALAAGGVSHGTYFATYIADDYIALAIESRKTEDTLNGRKLIFDNQCKIVLLSDRAVFIADGIISNRDPRAPRFDASVDAVAAYRRALPTGSLKNAADLWAADLKQSMIGLYPIYRSLIDHRSDYETVGGYFLGIDGRDKLVGFQARIMHTNGTSRFDSVVMPIQNDSYTFPGPADLVNEFRARQSARAKTLQRQIQKEATGKSVPEARIIELKYLVRNVPAWANDPGSGGDIAQVIIDAHEQRWRWVHRPDFCPEN